MEKNILYQDSAWMREHYINREESTYAIAEKAGCGSTTILRWLHSFGIPVRDKHEGAFIALRNFVNLSGEVMEILEGELLGDGCVSMNGNRSALYQHGSKYKEYVTWLSGKFSALGIIQSGRIITNKENGFGGITYRYCSKSYPELAEVRKRWYPGDKKSVPRDLVLTPTVVRHWYIGDGCNHRGLTLYTCGFTKDDVYFLIDELMKLGFKASYEKYHNSIGISMHSINDFLDFIGPCPISCYDYKWKRQTKKLRGDKS